MPVVSLSAGIHLIRAEVAATQASRATGLMYRESLAPNQGMLFVFPDAAEQCMWMRNTLIALSVAFLDAQGTVLNVEAMQPRTEDSHCAAAPAKFALEMAEGWFLARGIRSGSVIRGLGKVPASD